MACTVNKKAFCVLEFVKTESIVTVQQRFQTMYRTEPPTDKTIREWYMKFQQSGCLCAAKRRGRPRLSSVCEKRLSGALRSQQIARAGNCRCRTETWSVSPSVDMLPFGVTIPATVPQGSEIPEGLMKNPAYCKAGITKLCKVAVPYKSSAVISDCVAILWKIPWPFTFLITTITYYVVILF